MNKKGFAPLLVIAAILLFGTLAGLIASGKVNFADVLGGYDSVYKADWGHVGCIAGATETLAGPSYADAVSSTACTENVGTAGCNIILDFPIAGPFISLGTIRPEYKICNVDGSSCGNIQTAGSFSKGQSTSLSLAAGKQIQFLNNLGNGYIGKYYTFTRTGAVYSLMGEENGKIFTGNQGSCMISGSLAHQVVSESPNPIPFGTYQNYLLDFISVATQTYSYNGQNVICQARQIYSITNQQMKDGSTIKIQGDNIANVDCCPSEANCGTDFKFHTSVTRECTYSTECSNGGNPIPLSQTSAKYFTCESGTCVSHTKSVECTSDAVCQQRHGEGYVCDLSTQNYGTCKQSIGTFCGDGYCDIGESKATCPQDCSLECKAGEKVVTTTKNVNCKFLFWFCEQQTSQSCSSEWDWWKIIGIAFIFLLIIGGIIFLLNR